MSSQTPPPSQQPGCSNCGTPLRGAFCTVCGRPADRPTAPPTTPFQTAPFQTAPYQTAPQTTPQPTVPVAPDRAPAPPGSVRRLFLIGTLSLVLLAGLGVGGVFGVQWWLDRPTNQALGSARDAMSPVVDGMLEASSLDDLSKAGAAAPKARDAVEKARKELEGEDGTLPRLASDVLEDQAALLEALAPMEGLGEDSLTVWGTSLPAIEEAEVALLESRQALVNFEKGIGEDVVDPRGATDHAASVVATSATEILTPQLQGLLDEMESIGNTSQAAAMGERSQTMASAATAALTGQDQGDTTDLVHLATALGAVGELAEIEPEALHVWGDAKADLAEATDALGMDSTAARDAMSAWVEDAQQKMDGWETAYAHAESQRSEATGDLDAYSEEMKRILRDYDRARDATADALEQAGLDGAYGSYEVESAMEDGVIVRQELLTEMQYLSPPDGMGSTHDELVSVVESGVDAMLVGEQAVEDWHYCYDECADDYSDTAGWKEFQAASADITTRFDSARKSWVGALESALSDANAVPLPPMPKV